MNSDINNTKTVAILRLSDEAHNVAASYIEKYWTEKGFDVVSFRAENQLGGLRKTLEIIKNTNTVAVLVSSINGHAPLFLDQSDGSLCNFQVLKNISDEREKILTVIGGNLYPGDDKDLPYQIKHQLLLAGFDAILHNPSEVETVDMLNDIAKNIADIDRSKMPSLRSEMDKLDAQTTADQNTDTVFNLILNKHSVQKSVDIAINEYSATLGGAIEKINRLGIVDAIIHNFQKIESAIGGKIKTLPAIQKESFANGQILLQARTGVGNMYEQKKLWELMILAGADVVGYQVDSATRNHHFDYLEKQIQYYGGKVDGLNGIPVVNFGYENLFKCLTKDFLARGVPIEVRDGSADGILLKIHSLLSGCTSLEGGPLSYLLPYFPDYPIQKSIASHQVIDWICGELTKKGFSIDREYFGVQTAHIPHCIAGVSNILEALMSAEQGVKCISLGFSESGSRSDDIAMARITKHLTQKYLKQYGYCDVDVHVVWNTYMAAFPKSYTHASQLIFESGVSAAKSGVVTKILTKSPVEQHGIPSGIENAIGLSLTKKGIQMSSEVIVNEEEISTRTRSLERQILSILNPILNGGKAALPERVISSIKSGHLHIFGSPHKLNKCAVLRYMTFRGLDGAYYMQASNETLNEIFHGDRELVAIHASAWNEKRKKHPNSSDSAIGLHCASSEVVDGEIIAPFSGEPSIFREEILLQIKKDINSLEI